jgi:hypothetical protein
LVNDIPGLVNDIPAGDGKIDNLFLQCDIRKDGQKRVSNQDPCCCTEECNVILLCQLIFIVYFYLIFEVNDKKIFVMNKSYGTLEFLLIVNKN